MKELEERRLEGFIAKRSREENLSEFMDLDRHKKARRAEQEHNET